VLAALLACDSGSPFARPRPIPAIVHHGFRRDITDRDRGNAVFDAVEFSDDGSLFMTLHHLSPKLRVWDGQSGRLISSFKATLAETDLWLIDGRHRRFVGRDHHRPGLVIYDLDRGEPVSQIPADGEAPAYPLGLTDGGSALVVAVPGALEVWRLSPAERIRSVASPLPADQYRPGCTGGLPATYTDKRCWEFSPDRRWMALAFTPRPAVGAASRFYVIDLSSMTVEEIGLPDGATDRYLGAFAFSPDSRRLGFGTDRGLWFYELATRRWGPYVPGDHKRNPYLGAMRFSPDGRRLVALGDQLQISVYDVASGKRVGRWEPGWDDWEGSFRVSRDGSRAVIYHFWSDVLEVLDGSDAGRIGYLCPYFCNFLHNPVAVAFAVSPDGTRVVASHRYGAAIWDPDRDQLLHPLNDPEMPPLKAR
jgi:WD40 repeat protein